jgi:hypothetical protein
MLLLWNHLDNWNQTAQEWSLEGPLQSFCFLCQSEIQDGHCRRIYSWLSLSRTRLTRISSWFKFLSKSRTSLCINIYNLTPVESNSDESKFWLSRIKVLVRRCRKPYYLHSLSQIYMSKHVYYLGIKIGSQVKHPVIDFDIFTLGYFTCLF